MFHNKDENFCYRCCSDKKKTKCKKSKCKQKERKTCCHCKKFDINLDPECNDWDYIIVGFGAGGGPLARLLSDASHDGIYRNKVLLLEFGENYTTDPEVTSPNPFIFSNSLIYNPKISVVYTLVQSDDPAEAPHNLPRIPIYSEGRSWGGSTIHNFQQAVRGAQNTWDELAINSGNNRWSYNNILPTLKFLENYHSNGTSANFSQRGTSQTSPGGILDITQEPPIFGNSIMNTFANVSNAPIVADHNDPTNNNTGTNINVVNSANQAFITPPPNSKRTASYSYLPTSVVTSDGFGVNGRKLRIISDAIVSKVLFKGTTAVGIEYIYSVENRKIVHVIAQKKVILCAGAISTPAILQRSGIGDPVLLNSLGIPIIVANSNVGKNAQNHYGPSALISNPTPDPTVGLLTQGFINLSDSITPTIFPNDQIRRMQVLTAINGGAGFFEAFFPGLLFGANISPSTPSSAFFTSILNPNFSGKIEIVSKDPAILPKYTYSFYDQTDIDKILAFYQIIQDTATTYGQTVLYPFPQNYAAGAAGLIQAARESSFIAYHTAGSCRMATSPVDGVVDGNLEVFGTSNLMIADCSIFNPINTGNTSYPTYIAGLQAAKILGVNVPY